MHKMHSFRTLTRSSPPAAGFFSSYRMRGTQGARMHKTAQVLGIGRALWHVLHAQNGASFGYRTGSVARALGVQSRTSWIFFKGSHSAPPSRPPLQETPPFQRAAAVSHRPFQLSSSLLCGSDGTTAVAHQALPFVTATDGASVCAMFPAVLYEIRTKT